MKSYIIVFFSFLSISFCQGQMIKSLENETQISFDDLGEISLNRNLKLKDLYLMDKDFDGLKPLGKPLEVEEKDHVIYRSWIYKFENFQLTYVNRNGFKEIQKIIIYPSETRTVKIDGVVLRPNTQVEQLVAKTSGEKILKGGEEELRVKVTSEKGEVNTLKFKILLGENKNTIKSINISFKTI
jgi:hypothetical protein